MDVVTFNFKKLPDCTVSLIRNHARTTYPYGKSTPVERWFTDFGDNVTIFRIYGTELAQKMFITDYRITMPKDKYMEFCLTWL